MDKTFDKKTTKTVSNCTAPKLCKNHLATKALTYKRTITWISIILLALTFDTIIANRLY